MSGSVAAAIIAFGVMIFVHELGHFLVAKRVGITVEAFALGFGPKLVGVKRGGTLYAINLIPFGGYVKLAGEDLADRGGPDTFRAKTVWQRMAVLAAGPLMNLVLALGILAAIALVVGVPVGITNRIGQLMAQCPDDGKTVTCPSVAAKLRAGDAIVAINGVPMDRGETVIDTIHRSPHMRLRLTVERAGRRFDVEVTSVLDRRQKIGLIGYRPEAVREHMGPLQAVWWGARTVGQTTTGLLTALGILIARPREVMDSLMGPVGAVQFLGESARGGGELFLYTAAAMSVIIGVFNLFPIPPLDGSRLLFQIVEAVRRRPLDPRREGYINMVGFALLILLLVTLTVRDLGKL
jgi:regulator of sigma E protease